MSEPKLSQIKDEIELREVLLIMWSGKYLISLIVVLAITFSSIYLRGAERKYFVEAILKPVIEHNSGPNLSGLSGLASFAGVSLPKSSGSDFTTYQRLIFSEETSSRIFINQDLIVKLFKGEWDSNSKSFRAPPIGAFGELKQLVKSALTGVEKSKYIPPNPKRLSMLMRSSLNISLDSQTGFISVSTESSDPDIMLQLISSVSRETDILLKERFFATAEETLEFYYQKLLTSRSPEHRESLAKLISAEDQKLMLASKSSNFVAELLTTPSVSLYPTSPQPSRVFAIGFVLGVFFGVAIVLIRHSVRILRTQ